MSETPVKDDRHKHFPGLHFHPGLASLALRLAVVLACFLLSPVLHAQATVTSAASNVVYLAESENQHLNHRVKELLDQAFGESTTIRSFIPGQTSQDSTSPVIAIGPGAFTEVRRENDEVPVLGLFVEEPDVDLNASQAGDQASAILSSPSLIRQAAVGKAILPYSTRLAMLARPETEHLYRSVLDDLNELGMEGRIFLVPSDERLISTLIRALSYGDFILAAPDNTIYNPRTIKHILLTAYRRNRIVIGPSQAYVKAGSLASSYTPLRAVAQKAAEYIRHFWRYEEFPEPAYPSEFGIELNRQVGRSLNIPLLEREALIDEVIQRLENVEDSTDE